MSTSRPWWASEGPVGGGIDRTEDPLDVHRAARRGPDPGPAGGPAPGRDPGPGPDTGHDRADRPSERAAAGGATPGPTHAGAEVCGVCPICIAARIVGETRPELVAHLVEAGRHLAAAMRTLLDPGADRPDGSAGDRPPGEVRRIDLD